jgi:outer membrane protein
MRRRNRHRKPVFAAMAVAGTIAIAVGSAPASAETIDSAMARAYQNNPQLNAQRAQLRAVDEGVPQALSGYRPKLNVTATIGEQYADQTIKNVTPAAPALGIPQTTTYTKQYQTSTPYTIGATATQPVFDGFQTPNRVGAAESNVSAQREALRVLEQQVLLAAATAYMDVSRDGASLEVQRLNVRTLEELLNQTRERFNAGEVTSTDVSQAEAQLAAGRTAASNAESQYNTSRATYRQVIGVEPANLAPAAPVVDRFSPASLGAAIERGQVENPNVTAAMYGIDVAYLQVRINEGALFPQLQLQGTVQQASMPVIGTTNQLTASAVAALTVPIYQGGAEYALIRQSKETLEQQRLNLENVRNQIRQNVVQLWGQVLATKTQVESTQIQVNSALAALNGIRQEARVGQRTTFDILTAQQNLVAARLQVLVAQHDRVVASYGLLNATGRLAPQVLGLPTPIYDPTAHYQNARDAWIGLRPHEGDGNFPVGTIDASAAPPVRQAAATDTRAEPMQKEAQGQPTQERMANADMKGEDGKTEMGKADPRKAGMPLSLSQAAAGTLPDPAPEAMTRAAVRPVSARSPGKPMGRMPDGDLQPEDVLSPRDIQPEPGPTPAAPRMRSTGLMPGALPVISSDRFVGSRPPDPAPVDAAPAPRAPANSAPRSLPGARPVLPSDRFDTRASLQPTFMPSDRPDSFAEPAASGRPNGPFVKIR